MENQALNSENGSNTQSHSDDHIQEVAGETKSNNQLHESNSINEAKDSNGRLSPSITRRATKMPNWSDLPKKIKNRSIFEGSINEGQLYFQSDDVIQATKHIALSKMNDLYLQHDDEINCAEQNEKILSEINQIIESENSDNTDHSPESILKSKGKTLNDWIKIEHQGGKAFHIVQESIVEKTLALSEAETEYHFYKKWWEEIFQGQETGAELLLKAEENFRLVCKGFVPARISSHKKAGIEKES